jgi:hypothetical protein
MVASEKQKIIKSQGSTVTITNLAGQITTTKALIGRASKQFNNLLSLEAHRRAHFLPNLNVDSGFMVSNTVLNEDYLCVAVYPEMYIDKITSIATHMLLCNGLLTVKRDVKTGDDRGRVTTTTEDIVVNKKIYNQKITQELRLFDSGLSPTAEFLMYSSTFDIQLLDRVTVTNGVQVLKLKVDAVDKVTYPGLAIIQLCYETRS